MDERQQLIQQLDEARAEMRAALTEVDRRATIYPHWTIKEILAHIAGWDDAVTSSLCAHAGGDEPATPAVRGLDVYNAESVETRLALSFEQTVREWELSREQLKAALVEMPEEQFARPMLFPWGQTGTIAQLLKIWIDHEHEHARDVRNLTL